MELPNQAGLVVGIPLCGRAVTPEWALSLATQNYPLAMNVTYVTLRGREVGEARNEIAEEALKKKAKYVWFVDDDTAPPVFAIKKLAYELERNPQAMVCAGIYCTKEVLPEPVVFKTAGHGAFWNWTIGEVFECSGIGTGCMLVRTEVFTHLEKPWFKTVDKDCSDAEVFRVQQTDDLYFCDKVIAAGYKILAHGGVLPLHWDVVSGTPYGLPEDCFPVNSWKAKAEGVCV